MRDKILIRGSQIWAVGLVFTLTGLAVVVGAWVLLMTLGAPALSAVAITFGVGVIVAGGIGGVMRWLSQG